MSSKAQEFRRAWPVLLASTTGAGVGVAVLAFYSFSAFVGPLAASFGWSRAAITSAPLCFTVGSLGAGPLAGWLADRTGARAVALSSQLLLALGLAMLSLIGPRVWTLYAGYVLLAVLGAGTLPIIWSRAVTGWFVASRGAALGVSLMGTGICGALLPIYVSTLAAHLGWRGAYLGLAALPLFIGLPVAAFGFREPPEGRGLQIEATAPVAVSAQDYGFRDAVATWSFWRMSLCFFLAALALGSIMVHGLPLLASRGFGPTAAAGVVGLLGVFATVGRLVSGYFLDIFPAPRVAFVTFAIPALACLLLLACGHNLLVCALALGLVGLAAGAELDISGYFTAQFFGHSHYGAIYGLVYTLYGVGSGVGPALVGVMFDRTGSYELPLASGVALFGLAALLALTLRPPARPPTPWRAATPKSFRAAATATSARNVLR